MSVHIRDDSYLKHNMSVDGYDVRIVGGKRIIVPRRREQQNKTSSNDFRRYYSAHDQATRTVLPSLAQNSKFGHRQYGRTESNRPAINKTTSAPTFGNRGNEFHSTLHGRSEALPPIPMSDADETEETDERVSLQQHRSDVAQPSIALREAEEIRLKHSLSKALKNVTEDELHKINSQLHKIDSRRAQVLSSAEIHREFHRFKVSILSEQLKKLFLKYTSTKYPGLIEYNKMMAYLFQVKRLPALDISPLEMLPRDHNRKYPQAKRDSDWQSINTYFKQEEMPLLAELKRQLDKGSVSLATVYRHVSEMDRERKGVLSKSQIETILRKNDIHLSDNLLDSLLHYCDKNGYQLYSTSKFLDYFDRAVKEDRTLVKGGYNPKRVSRVRSPPPRPPLPVLQETVGKCDHVDMASTTSPYEMEEYSEELDSGPPWDLNEWTRRFNYMARALYNSHQDILGYLPRDEVLHIAQTYNIVYRLEIPSSIIHQIASQSVNYKNEQVDIRQFVTLLQSAGMRSTHF